jgi:hypothetical protein
MPVLRKLVDMNRSNVHRGKRPCELGIPLAGEARIGEHLKTVSKLSFFGPWNKFDRQNEELP